VVFLRLEPEFDADVVVAGAGPAGAAAACYLSRSGTDVLLLDRQHFPRDKVCGDFVGPVALSEATDLGLGSLPAFDRSNHIRRASLFLDGEHLVTASMPRRPGLPAEGRVIPRLAFDAWLVEAAAGAGAQVRTGVRVLDHEVRRDVILVRVLDSGVDRELRARVLVGADGSTSGVARRLRGHKPPARSRIIAVRSYYTGVAGPDDRADLLFSDQAFPGYCWVFPTGPDTANVGVGMALETVPRTEERLAELLDEFVDSDPVLRDRLAGARRTGRVVGWPLTTYLPGESLVGDRVLLVGDAGGLINPLNGEGIQYALQSGRWAAETLVECLDAGDVSSAALMSYARRVEAELRGDMALASLVVALIRNRALTPLWFWSLRTIAARAGTDPAYAATVGGILAGIVPAGDALGWRVLTGTGQEALASTLPRPGPQLLRSAAAGGVVTAGTAFGVAYDAVRSPADVSQWAVGVTRALAELARRTAVQAVTGSAQRSRSIM